MGYKRTGNQMELDHRSRNESVESASSQILPTGQPTALTSQSCLPTHSIKINQTQPINHRHRLDQIPPQIQMHAIKLVRLDAHIPGTEVIDPALTHLITHRLLKDLQRLVALGDDPLVRLERAGGVGGDEEFGPRSRGGSTEEGLGDGGGQIGRSGHGVGDDAVEPVDGGVEVEVVPEAVAEDEGIRFAGAGRGEEGLEAAYFGGVEGEFQHHFDDEVDFAGAAGEGVGVVGFDVGGFVDALQGAFFHVELLVAEAFFAV